MSTGTRPAAAAPAVASPGTIAGAAIQAPISIILLFVLPISAMRSRHHRLPHYLRGFGRRPSCPEQPAVAA
jgi:hypothetical protein